jgi:hypothetical protein
MAALKMPETTAALAMRRGDALCWNRNCKQVGIGDFGCHWRWIEWFEILGKRWADSGGICRVYRWLDGEFDVEKETAEERLPDKEWSAAAWRVATVDGRAEWSYRMDRCLESGLLWWSWWLTKEPEGWAIVDKRRAEYRATGVPSARGGKDVGLSSQRAVVRLRTVCTRRREWYRRLFFDVRPTVISGKDAGGQLGIVGRRWLWRRNGCSHGGRCVTGILEGMVRDRALVDTMLRAVDVDWVTVWRFLAEEMLRVTELEVRVVRVAGVAVIGRGKSGMFSG